MSFDPSTPGHFTILRLLRTLAIYAIIFFFFIIQGLPHVRLSVPRQGQFWDEVVYLGPQGIRRVYSTDGKPPLFILLEPLVKKK